MGSASSKSEELKERLDFINFNSEQKAALLAVRPSVVKSLDGALNKFYAKAKSHPLTKKFFNDDAHIAHAKERQVKHWELIASAQYDDSYVDAVSKIGQVHARLGLEPRWYIGGYALILEAIIRDVVASEEKSGGFSFRKKSTKVADGLAAVVKAALIDMDYAITVYLDVLAAERATAEAERARLQAGQDEALAALDQALTLLSGGDLTASISKPLTAEFEKLKSNFNTSVSALNGTLADVIAGTQQSSADTRELSQATDEMAKRIEQQAAALEETAAAIDQITVIAKQSASRTRDAQEVARSSADEAVKSGETVGEAIAAMSKIEDSSKKITQIISVIDEISFQTNLLALNAGVEAARAGEAGRGFAVVAQEVRELAQRSANAAKEIKTLIEVSTHDVVTGVSLVNRTGEALSRIGTQVRSINEHIGSIAQSAQEQSSAIAEINSAVNSMDQMTQQNAAMVEETNASTQNLMVINGNLAELVSRFRVSGAAGHSGQAQSQQRRYG
ncbi:methyl-accepting chemotaxis protein [Hoeflea marina]|uniref:Methyl-accepting chemotaxis protein n=1 Tax=Hoeflea marina TaxID=274592 RepID=A0A317PV88_9HYPH|nr:globin-coupled sensor protein [Hoeflea marina]PWW04605.1 methyl-accepting chemotaxis protein [Hoeflea marina]